MAFGDVADQTDYTDHFPLSVAMGSKSARLPQIAPVSRMLGYQSIRNLNNLSSQRLLQRCFYTARTESGEHFGRNLAEHIMRSLSSQPLHGRIEELVTQLGVIHDNAFGGVLDNLPIELNGLTQGNFIPLVFS